MRTIIKQITLNPLISGSSIVFIGTFGANIFNYLFNLLMGRLLTVSDYGLLTTLSSMIVLFGIFQISFTSIFAKFSASYRASDNESGFHGLITQGFKFLFLFSLIIFALLFILSFFLNSYLHINNLGLINLIFISVFISLIGSMPLGILQGEMRFKLLSFLYITSPIIKILIGVGLVLLGFQVFGAVMGFVLSSLSPFLIGYFLVFREHGKSKGSLESSDIFIKEIKGYSIKFLLASFGISILSNADIMLVRHFFGAETSGHYAALSLMGKAIFYIITPLYFVFFPLIAYKNEKKEDVLKILLLASGIVFGIGLVFSLIYFMVPQLVLLIFFPSSEYRILAPYLGPFSLYILVFSIVYLFNNYFLSIGKTGVYKINVFGGALFVVLMYLFHESLFQVILNLFGVSFLLFVLLLIYYKYDGSN